MILQLNLNQERTAVSTVKDQLHLNYVTAIKHDGLLRGKSQLVDMQQQ